jgi:hypothetical protein
MDGYDYTRGDIADTERGAFRRGRFAGRKELAKEIIKKTDNLSPQFISLNGTDKLIAIIKRITSRELKRR